MSDIQHDFFNLDSECPKEIPNCESLRQEYKTELEKYRAQNLCGPCIERSLRQKYTAFIAATIRSQSNPVNFI